MTGNGDIPQPHLITMPLSCTISETYLGYFLAYVTACYMTVNTCIHMTSRYFSVSTIISILYRFRDITTSLRTMANETVNDSDLYFQPNVIVGLMYLTHDLRSL